MNATRFAILGIILSAFVAAVALYYTQHYAFRYEVSLEDVGGVELTLVATELRDPIVVRDFQGNDSDSSPLAFKACFKTPHSMAMLTETFEIYDDPVPTNAPNSFPCFDAKEIGVALETGAATAFTSHANFQYGFDRVVAIFDDGRGYAWHQLNICGERAYADEDLPSHCPPVPEGLK